MKRLESEHFMRIVKKTSSSAQCVNAEYRPELCRPRREMLSCCILGGGTVVLHSTLKSRLLNPLRLPNTCMQPGVQPPLSHQTHCDNSGAPRIVEQMLGRFCSELRAQVFETEQLFR